MKLVEISKLRLQAMKKDGSNSLFEEVSKFYWELSFVKTFVG